MKKIFFISVSLLISFCAFAVEPKSWIVMRNFDVFEKSFADDYSKVYVYDVKNDEIKMKVYDNSFFHLGGRSVTDQNCYYGQAENFLFLKTAISKHDGIKEPEINNFTIYIYEISEDAEVKEIASIFVKDFTKHTDISIKKVFCKDNQIAIGIQNWERPWTYELLHFEIKKGNKIKFKKTVQVPKKYFSGDKFVYNYIDRYFDDLKFDFDTGYSEYIDGGNCVVFNKLDCSSKISKNLGSFIYDSKTKMVYPLKIKDGLQLTEYFWKDKKYIGNTLFTFNDSEGYVTKYTISCDGYVDGVTQDDVFKAIETGSASEMKHLLSQNGELISFETMNKIIESGNAELFREFILMNYGWDYYLSRGICHQLAGEGNIEYLKIINQYRPEWLRLYYYPNEGFPNYGSNIFEVTKDPETFRYLKSIGISTEINFDYILENYRCRLYKNISDPVPYTTAEENQIHSVKRIFTLNEKTGLVESWLVIDYKGQLLYAGFDYGGWSWGEP